MSYPQGTSSFGETPRRRGFTLVELLVVITILCILGAVVVFAVTNTGSQAQNNACTTDAKTVRTAIQAYRAMGHPWPTGDAHAVAVKLSAGPIQVLMSSTLKYNSATTAPPSGSWYYDPTSHTFTSRCDA